MVSELKARCTHAEFVETMLYHQRSARIADRVRQGLPPAADAPAEVMTAQETIDIMRGAFARFQPKKG